MENAEECASLYLPIFLSADIEKQTIFYIYTPRKMENFEATKIKSDSASIQKTQQQPQHTTSDPHNQGNKANPQQVAFPAHLPEKALQTSLKNTGNPATAGQQSAAIAGPGGQCFYASIQHISFMALPNYNFYFYHQPYNFSSPPTPTQTGSFIPVFQEISKQEREKSQQRNKRNLKKGRQSSRRNSESNIINQLYSHLANAHRSEKIVEKIISKLGLSSVGNSKQTFYCVARLINLRRGRKYVNKESILAFYQPQGCIEQFGELAVQLDKKGDLTLHNFCRIFRACTFHFLREEIATAVLTSKRIEGVAGLQHLRRRRTILDAMQVAPQ